jgi:nucleoside-diphosphate-sugar epimerase
MREHTTMDNAPCKILLTGAAGYLASWVAAQLLEAGHTVHGTVRSLRDNAKVEHLLKLMARHPGRLHLFEADLTQTGSFDTAMAGCSHVIHTASPYFITTPKDIDKELVHPALNGTLNVLEAVNRTPSVTRVVLTSSVVALYDCAKDVGLHRGHTVTEQDLNPNRDPRLNPYAYAKTVAEEAAWRMQAEQGRWDLVTVHPGAIFGPALSRRTDATSIDMMIQFLRGSFSTGVPRLVLGLVDVRDAAAVHVRAALHGGSKGRYIAVARSMSLLEIAGQMRDAPADIRRRLPRRELPKPLIWLIGPLIGMQRRYVAGNVGYPLRFDADRSVSELGCRYRNVKETIDDHIAQLLDHQLLDRPSQAARS